MRLRPLLGRLGLALASIVLTIGAIEAVLRATDYHFSPVVLVPPESVGDFRAFHIEGDRLAVFDPDLFWRPNPSEWSEMNDDGFRGRAPSSRADEVVVVAIGDSNTIGAPGTGEHWPADLQALIDHNSPPHPVRVVNAGCFGWGSLQGLRRFRQVLGMRPAVVFFSFGANEAHRVHETDAEYAERAAWLRRWSGLRLAAPVAHRFWTLFQREDPRLRPRVSLAEYRHDLEEFVDLARARGVTPVLLTRPYVGAGADPSHWITWAPSYRKATREVAAEKGATCLDVYRAFAATPKLFQDESHYNRMGRHRMAGLLLRHLRTLGLVATDQIYSSEVEPGETKDAAPELGPGWWAQERWPAGWGRWTAREAVLYLERHGDEDRLDVELGLLAPRNFTASRVEVNGRTLAEVSGQNGPWRASLDLRRVPDRELVVRFVTDRPYVPREIDPGATDARTLGIFVYSVRLRSST
jgi:lysophospholipase L1-like esterase